MYKIIVRWTDGNLETFLCKDFRVGHAYLWVDLDITNRWIPTTNIRWYSIDEEYAKEPDVK